MSKKTIDEASDREILVRMDERVRQIHEVIPLVRKHDKEILVAKVLGVVGLVVAAAKYPAIAAALADVLK